MEPLCGKKTAIPSGVMPEGMAVFLSIGPSIVHTDAFQFLQLPHLLRHRPHSAEAQLLDFGLKGLFKDPHDLAHHDGGNDGPLPNAQEAVEENKGRTIPRATELQSTTILTL